MGIVTFRTEALLFTSSQDLMSQLQVSYYLYKKKKASFPTFSYVEFDDP
jgi:hypothetical protein